MGVSVAGEEKAEEDRWQVSLKASVRGVTGNRIDISGWYTIFDLGGIYDLIVGKDWMAANLHIIDHKTNTLHMLEPDWSDLQQGSRLPSTIVTTSLVGLRPHQGRMREVRAHCKTVARRSAINLVSTSFVAKCKSSEIFIVNIQERIDKIMEEEEEATAHKPADLETWRLCVRKAFPDLFEPPTGLPPASKHHFRIDTDPTAEPPHRKPHRMSDSERLEFETHIAKLLANGRVTDSQSPFAAPVIFVKKPDGSGLRMCVDYRGLNAITTRDRYPLPYIQDLIDRLHGCRVLTKLDLASGYHQLRIHPDDRHKTAFVAPDGFYKWTVFPFGLANAPSAFMRAMHRILGPYKKFAIAYLDDVLIFSRSLAEHKMHVDTILLAIRAAHLRLNERKCVFGATETSFVGFKVNLGGIHTQDRKIAAINDWPVPASTAQLRSFLGLAGYYRKFVHKFAHRTTQLYALRADKSAVRWLRKHQAEFDNFRRALASAPVLALRDPDRDYILRTDASDVLIGGVLAQKQPWGPEGRLVERPLGFFSQKLHDVETRYAAYDRELFAIHDNLMHWEPYLSNRHTSVYTDHALHQHILSQQKLSGRQWRHLDKLQQFDCSIKYFPGAANLIADTLSRIHHPVSTTPAATISINTMELQIIGAEEWKQEVCELLVEGAYFGPIVNLLRKEAEVSEEWSQRLKEKHHRKNMVWSRLFRLDCGLPFRRDTGALCIPTDMRSDVILEAHDSPLGGGHQGAEKTAAAIASWCYWPHWTQTVRAWVWGRDVCHRVKHSNQLPYGLLQPLPIPETRASRVFIDFITKLPATTRDGYDCIITIVDLLPKRVRRKAARDKDLTAEVFAREFIDMWVRKRGIPDDIISDRDTRFMSDFWGSLTAQLGIKRRHSTAYHPQTDGQAENLNAVVERYLKA